MSSRDLTAEDIAVALADPAPCWLTLPSSGSEIHEHLRQLLGAFDAGNRPAGAAATRWLRDRALIEHQTSRTRVLIAEQRVAGYYSLASAHVRLTQRHRRRLILHTPGADVPAALVTWIAKDHRTGVDGRLLLMHATATARQVSTMQAAAVLVLDPFDEPTGEMWEQRYGFRRADERSGRLWLPLN